MLRGGGGARNSHVFPDKQILCVFNIQRKKFDAPFRDRVKCLHEYVKGQISKSDGVLHSITEFLDEAVKPCQDLATVIAYLCLRKYRKYQQVLYTTAALHISDTTAGLKETVRKNVKYRFSLSDKRIFHNKNYSLMRQNVANAMKHHWTIFCYTVKKVSGFSVPRGMSLTKLFLARNPATL